MIDREKTASHAAAYFNDLWRRDDPWELQTNPFEHDKYRAQLALLDAEGRRYGRSLEIGCAAGVFTRQLAERCDSVLAVDIAEPAIANARRHANAPNVEYRVGNIMEWDSELDGDWDLIVLAETVCYLGWLYPFFDIAWLAHRLYMGCRPGGQLLLTNTCGGVDDHLLRPWIIRTYHDLFRNAGFGVRRDTVFRGAKSGVEIEAMITLFERPA